MMFHATGAFFVYQNIYKACIMAFLYSFIFAHNASVNLQCNNYFMAHLNVVCEGSLVIIILQKRLGIKRKKGISKARQVSYT